MSQKVCWLLGREGGLGLVPMVEDYAGHLLLIFGDAKGAMERGAAYALGPEARKVLRQVLDRYEETGLVNDPANWPADLWGEGPAPAL